MSGSGFNVYKLNSDIEDKGATGREKPRTSAVPNANFYDLCIPGIFIFFRIFDILSTSHINFFFP